MTTEIIIKIEDGCISVWKDGKTTGQLCWDEMLGQIVELTHPDVKAPRYPMLTTAEWDEKRNEWRKNAVDKQPEVE